MPPLKCKFNFARPLIGNKRFVWISYCGDDKYKKKMYETIKMQADAPLSIYLTSLNRWKQFKKIKIGCDELKKYIAAMNTFLK